MAARILVVDDEPDVLELERMFLTRAGYEVDVAPDGRAALEMVAAGAYDLIVLDVMMPGLDGFDVCREIKADPKQLVDPPGVRGGCEHVHHQAFLGGQAAGDGHHHARRDGRLRPGGCGRGRPGERSHGCFGRCNVICPVSTETSLG